MIGTQERPGELRAAQQVLAAGDGQYLNGLNSILEEKGNQYTNETLVSQLKKIHAEHITPPRFAETIAQVL